MDKVRARISEMPNRCKSVVDSSRRARYNNVEEEIKYFGVSLKYTTVPSILTPTGGCQCDAYLITVRPTTLLNMDVRDEVIQVAYEPTCIICLYRAGYLEG
jgi:hypothetical protein